ncbi:hypothetical protein C8J57DRAFT_1718606 [Mycena rebaudengoi]|nr:hypothetical protein C8J57DRAFT_1718606 [Mycena rebaudengoi]
MAAQRAGSANKPPASRKMRDTLILAPEHDAKREHTTDAAPPQIWGARARRVGKQAPASWETSTLAPDETHKAHPQGAFEVRSLDTTDKSAPATESALAPAHVRSPACAIRYRARARCRRHTAYAGKMRRAPTPPHWHPSQERADAGSAPHVVITHGEEPAPYPQGGPKKCNGARTETPSPGAPPPTGASRTLCRHDHDLRCAPPRAYCAPPRAYCAPPAPAKLSLAASMSLSSAPPIWSPVLSRLARHWKGRRGMSSPTPDIPPPPAPHLSAESKQLGDVARAPRGTRRPNLRRRDGPQSRRERM